MRRVTLYRDDSTVQVVYDRVKSLFWTAGNTVLVIAQYDLPGACPVEARPSGDGYGAAQPPRPGPHHYIHWPRERFCWFRDESAKAEQTGEGE